MPNNSDIAKKTMIGSIDQVPILENDTKMSLPGHLLLEVNPSLERQQQAQFPNLAGKTGKFI